MKAADVAVLVLCLAMAAGAFGAFYWWRGQEAQAAEQAYEARIDEIVDNKIGAVRLDFLASHLGTASDRSAAWQALYADPDRSDHLNLAFGTLQGDFYASYANHAEEAGRRVERDRFQREVDERWGEGAFTLMRRQYEAFLADAPRRQAEENARMLQDCLRFARAAHERRFCQSVYGAPAAAPAAP